MKNKKNLLTNIDNRKLISLKITLVRVKISVHTLFQLPETLEITQRVEKIFLVISEELFI